MLVRGVGGYTVYRPDHWALEGTELCFGDVFGQENILCSYEMDGCAYTIREGLPVPTGEDGTSLDFEIIATASASLGEPENTKLQGKFGYFDASFVARRIFGADTKENRDRARRGQAAMGTFNKGRGSVLGGHHRMGLGVSRGKSLCRPHHPKCLGSVLEVKFTIVSFLIFLWGQNTNQAR